MIDTSKVVAAVVSAKITLVDVDTFSVNHFVAGLLAMS